MSDYETIKTISEYGITLYRRSVSPNIYYYFTLNKKSYRGSTGTSNIKEGVRKAEKRYWDIEEGRGKSRKTKFNIIVKEFLGFKENRLSPRTFEEYKRESKFLVERFKNKDISTFTKRDYYKYEKWRREYYITHEKKRTQKYKRNGHRVEGCQFKDPGNVTINREIGLLVSILRYSQSELNLIQNKIVPGWKKLPENTREEVLERDEYEKLKEYWLKRNHYYWDIISFVQNTGVRYPSEVNGLKWKDVMLRKSYMVIKDRKGKPPVDMSVPLIGTAKDVLERLLSRKNIPKGPDDYVFVNDRGRRIKNIRKAFHNSLVKCGIDKELSMYSLRHTFTTRMVKTRPDVPLKIIAAVLGHKDTRMIDRHYAHLRIEDVVHILERSEDRKEEIKKQREQQ